MPPPSALLRKFRDRDPLVVVIAIVIEYPHGRDRDHDQDHDNDNDFDNDLRRSRDIRTAALGRFLSIVIPACLSLRPPAVPRQEFRRATMRLLALLVLALLAGRRKSGAIWYGNLRQSPERRAARLRRNGIAIEPRSLGHMHFYHHLVAPREPERERRVVAGIDRRAQGLITLLADGAEEHRFLAAVVGLGPAARVLAHGH